LTLSGRIDSVELTVVSLIAPACAKKLSSLSSSFVVDTTMFSASTYCAKNASLTGLDGGKVGRIHAQLRQYRFGLLQAANAIGIGLLNVQTVAGYLDVVLLNDGFTKNALSSAYSSHRRQTLDSHPKANPIEIKMYEPVPME
jgi:hypothetical protein